VQLRHYQGQNDDWHLYICFSNWARSSESGELLVSLLEGNNFSVNTGDLDIQSAGTRLPIPLQDSFIWLNEECQLVVRRDELSLEQALTAFLSDIAQSAVDPAVFIAAIKTQLLSGQKEIVQPVANTELSRQSNQTETVVQTNDILSALQRKPSKTRRPNKQSGFIQLALPIGNLAACSIPESIMPGLIEELESRPPP
jgi:hypothetical protein